MLGCAAKGAHGYARHIAPGARSSGLWREGTLLRAARSRESWHGGTLLRAARPRAVTLCKAHCSGGLGGAWGYCLGLARVRVRCVVGGFGLRAARARGVGGFGLEPARVPPRCVLRSLLPAAARARAGGCPLILRAGGRLPCARLSSVGGSLVLARRSCSLQADAPEAPALACPTPSARSSLLRPPCSSARHTPRTPPSPPAQRALHNASWLGVAPPCAKSPHAMTLGNAPPCTKSLHAMAPRVALPCAKSLA